MTTLAPARFQHRSFVEYAALLAVLALVVRNLGLVVMCLVLTIWTIRSLMPPRRFARAAGETDNISTR